MRSNHTGRGSLIQLSTQYDALRPARYGVDLPFAHGCVTTGDDGPTFRWLFMKPTGTKLVIDTRKCYLAKIGERPALFVSLIDKCRAANI